MAMTEPTIFADRFTIVRLNGGAYLVMQKDKKDLLFHTIASLNNMLKRHAIAQAEIDAAEQEPKPHEPILPTPKGR